MNPTTVGDQFTFADYLQYEDDTEQQYELEDGKLIIMTPPSGYYALIIYFLTNTLVTEIQRLNLPWLALQNIAIRTAVNRVRIPDLCIIHTKQIQDCLNKTAVIESPPLLVIEVVSPGSKIRDYRFKRSEYSVLAIPEYWILDYDEQKITILHLIDGLYEIKEYQGNTEIISQVFLELKLTPNQILNTYT